jgi:hypothetical protein
MNADCGGGPDFDDLLECELRRRLGQLQSVGCIYPSATKGENQPG